MAVFCFLSHWVEIKVSAKAVGLMGVESPWRFTHCWQNSLRCQAPIFLAAVGQEPLFTPVCRQSLPMWLLIQLHSYRPGEVHLSSTAF